MDTLAVLLRLAVALGSVVGLIWLVSRGMNRGRGSRVAGLTEVVARQQLSRAASVVVVRVGERNLVLGVTEQQVSLLTETDLPAPDPADGVREVVELDRCPTGARRGAEATPAAHRAEGPAHGRSRRLGAVTGDLDPGAGRAQRADDATMTAPLRARTAFLALVLAALATLAGLVLAAPASAAPGAPSSALLAAAVPAGPAAPTAPPTDPTAPTGAPTTDPLTGEGPVVSVDVNGIDGKPSGSIVVILAITALSVAPALLLMTTAFTKIFVVLSITRNALGLMAVPPNQVIAGLALFLSLFVMGPVLTEVNDIGVQPYLAGDLTQQQAFDAGIQPLRDFMLGHTRAEDLALMSRAADRPNPPSREETPLLTLIPAFVLSELRSAFIIGFVVFVPFLVIDLVVSAALMSMGMMMLPPVTVSLPFKLLLFVLVDGWGLVVTAVVGSYGSGMG